MFGGGVGVFEGEASPLPPHWIEPCFYHGQSSLNSGGLTGGELYSYLSPIKLIKRKFISLLLYVCRPIQWHSALGVCVAECACAYQMATYNYMHERNPI